MRRELEVTITPGEGNRAIVVGGGLPEDGIGPREWLRVEEKAEAVVEG